MKQNAYNPSSGPVPRLYGGVFFAPGNIVPERPSIKANNDAKHPKITLTN